MVLLTSNCDTLSWKTEIGRAITMNLYQSGVDPLRPTHPLSVQLVQVSQFLFDKCHLSMFISYSDKALKLLKTFCFNVFHSMSVEMS